MSRLVQPKPALSAAREGDGANDGDDYATRVAKYVPAETVAGYAFIEGLIRANAPVADWLPAGAFLLGLIAAPAYIWRLREAEKPWIGNAVLAAAAFPVWAYNLQGSFFGAAYDPAVAGFLLVALTLAAGLYRP